MEMKDIQLEVIYILLLQQVRFCMSLIKADTYIVKERRGEEKGVYIERRVSREECREKSVERRVSREEMVRYGGCGGGCG
jgi:hypothetical protein